jgi:hypothetical protein
MVREDGLQRGQPPRVRRALQGDTAATMSAVRYTAELDRIVKLPRRTQSATIDLARDMTEALRKDVGTQTLFPVQALALLEAMISGGLLGSIGVGEGKTLITLLAPYVLEAKRYLLLLPANLIDKTRREHARYAKDWLIPPLGEIFMLSYDMLGRTQSEHTIKKFAPDLVGADEVHRLKNRRAACTRRVIRYMQEHPETRFLGLSGTIMQSSVRDFAHIARWCLKGNAPVPRTEGEVEEWALAIDEKVPDETRYQPGALLKLCSEDELRIEPIVAARRGFRRRLAETPGFVSTVGEGDRVTCSIYVSDWKPTYKPITDQHFLKLRSLMRTPDDWELMTGADVWRHARELALGFHYVWDPRPPEPWRVARRDWHSFCRDVLSRSHTLDSEEHVAQAVDRGSLHDGGVLARWRALRHTYRQRTRAIWHDESVLELAADWMDKPGIVWVEHTQFAERLSEITGAKYFGADGLAPDGQSIEDATEEAVVASIKANKEGRNLQAKWSRNLVLAPPDNADVWEQMIGRTHRKGQRADEVTVDVILGCLEHANAFRRALSGAEAVRDTIGAAQKLLIADIDWPADEEVARYRGPRWKKQPAPSFLDEVMRPRKYEVTRK